MNRIEFIKFKNIEQRNNIVTCYLGKKKRGNNQKVNYKKQNIN